MASWRWLLITKSILCILAACVAPIGAATAVAPLAPAPRPAPAAGGAQQGATARPQRQAIVSSASALKAAFENTNIDEIQLAADMSLKDALQGAVIRLQRNLTVSSVDPRDRRILDCAFLRGGLVICPACTLEFRDVALKNDRRGAYAYMDAVVGEGQGSRLVMHDVARMRDACVEPIASLEQTRLYPRSPAFPGRQQRTRLGNATFRGASYPISLFIDDLAVRIEREAREHGAWGGGYDMLVANTTRICKAYAERECLKLNPPDICVLQALEAKAAAAAAAAGPSHASSSGSVRKGHMTASLLAIAVPAAAIVLAALVVAIVILVRQHRHKHPTGRGRRSSKSIAAFWPGAADWGGTREGSATETQETSEACTLTDSWEVVHEASRHGVPPRPVTPTGAGSRLLSGPLRELAHELRMGTPIGAGSFGRVYHSVWRGLDVAIKVIDHGDDVRATTDEADLLLSLNHHNVVKAYHILQCTEVLGTPPATSAAASGEIAPCVGPPQPPPPPPPTLGPGDGARLTPVMPVLGFSDPTPPAAPIGPQPPAAEAGPPPVLITINLPEDSWPIGVRTSDPPSTAAAAARAAAAAAALAQPPDARGRLGRSFLVMEHCDGGDLLGVLARLRAVAPAASAQFQLNLLVLLEGAAAGLEYMHAYRVVHGDLNTRNVLVSTEQEPGSASFGAVAKVADFGLARLIEGTHRTTRTCGTINHMPPERLGRGEMSAAGDVYAFGIMMWEAWTCESAFDGLHFGQVCAAVVVADERPVVPPDCPADYAALMAACWEREAEARPAMAAVRSALQGMITRRTRALGGEAEGTN